VKLRFLGKDSTPDDSPTLYATDQDSYVIQGWIITDATILARLTVSDDETVVEVPTALLDHLALDGLHGEVTHVVLISSLVSGLWGTIVQYLGHG
jgi:hypothetical protein